MKNNLGVGRSVGALQFRRCVECTLLFRKIKNWEECARIKIWNCTLLNRIRRSFGCTLLHRREELRRVGSTLYFPKNQIIYIYISLYPLCGCHNNCSFFLHLFCKHRNPSGSGKLEKVWNLII